MGLCGVDAHFVVEQPAGRADETAHDRLAGFVLPETVPHQHRPFRATAQLGRELIPGQVRVGQNRLGERFEIKVKATRADVPTMLFLLQIQLLPSDHETLAGQGHAGVGADAGRVDDDLGAQRLAGRGENAGDHVERLGVLLLVGHPHGGKPAAGQGHEA